MKEYQPNDPEMFAALERVYDALEQRAYDLGRPVDNIFEPDEAEELLEPLHKIAEMLLSDEDFLQWCT